jgi:hypothetical protein
MKKINIDNNTKNFTYLSIVLCLLFLMLYLWLRFFRERLPRDIPFNLTIILFIILCLICIGYLLIIIQMIKPRVPNKYILIIINKLVKITQIMDNVDSIIKNNTGFNTSLNTFFYKIIILFKLYKTNNNRYFYIILNLIPKVCLLLLFSLDIFFLKKMELFYKYIFIGIIPLIYDYIVYSIAKALASLITDLEKNYYVKILSTAEDEDEGEYKEIARFMVFINNLKYNDYGVLDLGYFVDIQANNLIFDCDVYKYTCIETEYAREVYARNHNIELPDLWVFEPLSDEISTRLAPYFFDNIEKAINFQAFIETHKDLTKPRITRTYYIYILISYLFCWLYILIISVYSLNIFELSTFLEYFRDDIDPFSNTNIRDFGGNID